MGSDTEVIRREFGRAVRRQRNKTGMSQENLAQIAGIDRTYLSGIERGVRNPTLEKIVELAQAMGCSVGEFFGDEG